MMKEGNFLVGGTHQQRLQSQWIDAFVQAATTANKFFTLKTSFHRCHAYEYDYVDKQVEFETRNEGSHSSASPMERLMMRTRQAASAKVELCRKCLFDEDSVVDNVSHREIPEYLTDKHESDYKTSEHHDQDHDATQQQTVCEIVDAAAARVAASREDFVSSSNMTTGERLLVRTLSTEYVWRMTCE
jgi:hypothetical protein